MPKVDEWGMRYTNQHHLDVSNPLLVPDVASLLVHHKRVCPVCEGVRDEDDECYECLDAEEYAYWAGWDACDVGVCGSCGAEDVPVCEAYDTGLSSRDYVCVVCYVLHHKQECGCALWVAAEKALHHFLVSHEKPLAKEA